MSALRGVCHQGSQSIRAFVVSTFVVLLVVSYSRSACLVSQIRESVTEVLLKTNLRALELKYNMKTVWDKEEE